jgi:hypothetical protein
MTGTYYYGGIAEGNLIYNTRTNSLGYGLYNDAGNTIFDVMGNTFYNTTGVRFEMDGSVTQHGNTYVNMSNNIFQNFRPSQDGYIFLGFYRTSLPTSNSNYNMYFNPFTPTPFASTGTISAPTTYSSLSNWQSSTGEDQNSMYQDPLLVNPSAEDFSLESNSPAIDNGTFIDGYHCARADDNQTDPYPAGDTSCRHWYGAAPDMGAFEYEGPSPPDVTPPSRSNGQPSGTLTAGTTSTTLSLSTNETATCRYATTSGVSYNYMANNFSTTGSTSHSTLVSGLQNGNSYSYYVRCQDVSLNNNTDDYLIQFSVASGSSGPSGDTPPSEQTPQNHAPVANPGGPYRGYVNQSVLFNGNSSSDPDNDSLTFLWDFGDGNTSSLITPRHIYSVVGHYNVSLLVTDSHGKNNSNTTTATIILNSTSNNASNETQHDTDHDGLPDSVEEDIGSDQNNQTDVFAVIINESTHFLVDIDHDGVYDIFYNNDTHSTTPLELLDGSYLIDTDGDSKKDMIFHPETGIIESYSAQVKTKERMPLGFILVLSFIIGVIALVVVLFKIGFFKDKT